MKRGTVAAIALAVLLAATTAGTALAVQPGGPSQADNGTETDAGPTMASVLEVQGATLDRAVAVTALQERLDAAGTPAARAQVIAGSLARTEGRLTALDARLDALRAARENGTITEETYANRVAPVVARARSLDAVTGRLRAAADGIDARTLRSAEVTDDRFATLQSRTDRVIAAGEGVVGTTTLGQSFFDRVATVASGYNERADAVDLGLLGSMASGERVNLRIDRTNGGTSVISFRTTADARVRSLRAGPRPDATLRITVDESTARRLLDADNPGAAASDAFAGGAIAVDGLGAYNAVRWTIASAVLGVVRAVTGLVGWLLSVVPW
jgi:alkylhydroperoxidase family enzyme